MRGGEESEGGASPLSTITKPCLLVSSRVSPSASCATMTGSSFASSVVIDLARDYMIKEDAVTGVRHSEQTDRQTGVQEKV